MRRINNAREELERNDEKTERKRSANRQRKKSLEDHLAGLVEQKRKLDVEAAEKTRSAVEVENKVRFLLGLCFSFVWRVELTLLIEFRSEKSMLRSTPNLIAVRGSTRKSRIKSVSSNPRLLPPGLDRILQLIVLLD